jgi:nucleoside-diphosphate-sugar epimerase
MNILITGIHGFVGTNLVQALKANHSIYGLDIVTPTKDGVVKTFGWNELDALPPIDAVIHLAGKAHDTKNQTVAQTYFDINTGLTQKIYDWFRASSASKFIFFSSVKAAADKVEGVLTEDVEPTPLGPYGESKIAAEKYILSLQSAVCSDKKPELQTINCKLQTKNFFILRPCMIHGPGNKGNLNLLYNVVKRGIPYPLGAFENRRSFCSIDNLSYVINGLITGDVASGIYNVCDDETISTNELIELISTSMGKKSRIWRFSKPIIEFVAKAGTLLHLPLTTERLQKLTESYVVSNVKIKKALGIAEMPVRANKGLIKTLNSFSN